MDSDDDRDSDWLSGNSFEDGFLYTETRPMSLNARAGLSRLSNEIFDALNHRECEIVLDAFFYLDIASKGTELPRDFQLQATIAILNGKDLILRAGTGYGKTLAMVVPALLNHGKITITISPLRLIQENHVWGIYKPSFSY